MRDQSRKRDRYDEIIRSLSPEKRALFEMRLNNKVRQVFNHETIHRLHRGEGPNRFPVSFAQQRMWLAVQLGGAGSAYNMAGAYRLKGKLNIATLEGAFNEIIRRHETLRTRFQVSDGSQVQEILAYKRLSIDVIDLRDLKKGEWEAQIREIARLEGSIGFQLEVGPLIRIRLARLGPFENMLLVTMHHIISDGWSIGIMVNDLAHLFTAFQAGRESPLTELEVQYADYAVWQRGWLQGEALERRLEYWRQRLAGAPILEAPTDYPRPAVPSRRGATEIFSLPLEITRELSELSQREGVTLFVVLLAAFQLLLGRYAGQEDIVVGCPVANRNRLEIEGLIGFFVNTIVVRTALGDGLTVRELLRRVREAALDAIAQQDLPFEKLVEELQPQRSLSHEPLFQVMFTFQHAPSLMTQLGDLQIGEEPAPVDAAKFDLTLSLVESGNQIRGAFEYATDLYTQGRIQRLQRHLLRILEVMLEDEEQRVGDINLLTVSERQQVLIEWNDTEQSDGERIDLTLLFERQIERTPDATAVVFEDQSLSYEALNDHAELLASFLRSMGVTSETPVAICVERSLWMTIGLIGVLKTGGAYIPLDPDYPVQRLSYMLEDSQSRVLLTQKHLLGQLAGYSGKVVCLDGGWEQGLDICRRRSKTEIEERNLAYMIYTSGSTGRPKGAMNTHGGIVNRLKWMQGVYALSSRDRVLQKTTFSFDVSVWELFWPLLTGAVLVMMRPRGQADPRYLKEVIETEQITTLHFVPSMLEIFLENEQWEGCRSVRQVMSSGEALTEKLVEKFYKLSGKGLSNLYGPTEAAVDVTYQRCVEGGRVRIGKPIANIQIYVLDRKGSSVPEGVYGELHIGGVGVGRGYWNKADQTAESFIPNPFADEGGGRLYRTGDQVRWTSDGELEYLGRLDEQVKIRGFRIELGEIEAILIEHEAVSKCAVITREDLAGEKCLTAYVVGSEEEQFSEPEFREYLRKKLPGYMIPSDIVRLENLPLTPNGKLDRNALPAPTGVRKSEDRILPRTQVEEIVAGIWRDVLNLDRVGVKESFFDLGGHSLMATQVISRIRDAFDVDIHLWVLFDGPTVEKLAEIIEVERNAGRRAPAPPIVSVERNSELPLSYAQQRLWFVQQLEPESIAYNIPYAINLYGNLNIAALCGSLNQIVRRHEVLRTRYIQRDGRPIQVIEEPREITPPLWDISGIEEEEREKLAVEIVRQGTRRAFDLERGPVWRAALVRIGIDKHILLLSIHHVASDGWSTGILVREFTVFYESCLESRPAPLTDLPVQYADYAVWQRQWLQGAVLQEHVDYWKWKLRGLQALELPTDRTRPVIFNSRGAWEKFSLSKELTGKLRLLSQQAGATLFMTLLTGLQLLLARYTGKEDIAVSAVIAGRNREDTKGLIGFFVNQLILRTDLSGNPTVPELLARVRETALGAYEHQDLPFQILVEELRPERNLSNQLFTPVVIAYQNIPQEAFAISDLIASSRQLEINTTEFDITLFVNEADDEIQGGVLYAEDLFDRETIVGLLQHLQRIFEMMVV